MKNILTLALISALVLSCTITNSQRTPIQEWAISNAQKIEGTAPTSNTSDINSLGKIVGDARVVCLGESRHDIHEQFLLKLRFVKYLVEEMNFTTFALEGSLPYSNRINNYILSGEGNINELMANMPGWFLWDTEEIKELFEWFHEYNRSTQDKVRFYGIDIVAPNDALSQVFDYLQIVDLPFYEKIEGNNFARNSIDDTFWQNTLQEYAQISQEDKKVLALNYTELYQHIKANRESYISNSSEEEYEWMLTLAFSATEANKMFSTEDRIEMGVIRDQAMATISSWIEKQNDKLIIWAHNVHIAKSTFSMSMFPDTEIKGMGAILHDEFGDEMVAIGASFNTGEFINEGRRFEPATPESIDGMLAKLGMEYFLLNLHVKSEKAEVNEWLNTENTMRGQEFEMTCVPAKAFDAFFFTNWISKVQYKPSTVTRMGN